LGRAFELVQRSTSRMSMLLQTDSMVVCDLAYRGHNARQSMLLVQQEHWRQKKCMDFLTMHLEIFLLQISVDRIYVISYQCLVKYHRRQDFVRT
jgi:hypothetical protein